MPDEVTFATKPELARRMVARVPAAGLPAAWVTGDTVYGAALRCARGSKNSASPLCWPSPPMMGWTCPPASWRHVAVTARRTKRDYAEVLRYLVEERYPDAECICVVQDNLNTHTAGALSSTRPSRPSKPVTPWPAWSSTLRPSTAVGSTRLRSKAASLNAAVSRVQHPTWEPWSNGSRVWQPSALRDATRHH